MNEACAVCGRSATKEYAIVAAGERLCIGTIDSCFGWFSGYPWVLFEAGMLVSRLWKPGDDPHMFIGRRQ